MSCYIVLPLLHVVLHCATSPLPVVLHCATSPPLSTVSDPYASFHEAWRENDFLGRYLVSLRCSYHRCVDMYTSFPLFRSFFFSPSLLSSLFRILSSLSRVSILYSLFSILYSPAPSLVSPAVFCHLSAIPSLPFPPYSCTYTLCIYPLYTLCIYPLYTLCIYPLYIPSVYTGNFQTDCWGHWRIGK